MIYDGETEEQAAERIRRARARAALRAAPETAARLRAAGLPADGRTEAGDLPEWRTPLITDPVDSADRLFVQLRDWAEIWASRLDVDDAYLPPVWALGDGTPRGFRAGTGPVAASTIVHRVTSWLIDLEERISAAPGAEFYFDDVTKAVWPKRTAARMHPINVDPPRPCPNCGAEEVRGVFFGEPMEAAEARGEELLSELEGVGVRCAACGWQPELRASQIARWLS